MNLRLRTVPLLCVALMLGAEKAPDAPTSAPARAARAKYDRTLADAQAAYERAVAAAKRAYLGELRAALDAAMTAKNLDEANRINEELKRAQEGGAEPPAAAVKPVAGPNPFLGKWKGAQLITIARDGTIVASNNLRGTWLLQDGRCHIRWESGVVEVLTLADGGAAVTTEWGKPGEKMDTARWTRVRD